ncbi:hypothetical protein ABW19_dt0205110 [Dactylella cylindrospora]|nr:hypothetical protein ABW19_dt0205110 [Dactylella cylindrospora]
MDLILPDASPATSSSNASTPSLSYSSKPPNVPFSKVILFTSITEGVGIARRQNFKSFIFDSVSGAEKSGFNKGEANLHLLGKLSSRTLEYVHQYLIKMNEKARSEFGAIGGGERLAWCINAVHLEDWQEGREKFLIEVVLKDKLGEEEL